jgi:RNA polymerase sigma-70 factor (ECF subfamily)
VNTPANHEWLEGLRKQDEIWLQKLHDALKRGLTASFRGRLAEEQLYAFAEDITQTSLLKILAALDSFEGRSQFLTWAMKIAVRTAISELRHVRWQDVSIEKLVEEGFPISLVHEDTQEAPSPETALLKQEIIATLQAVIANELTEQQRTVLLGVVLHGMPIDEVALQRSISRNAVYKTIYDARRKLADSLAEAGFPLNAILEVFS